MTIDKPEQMARILSGYYDDEWLTMDPAIIILSLKKNFNFDLGEEHTDRFEAIREVLRSDRVFKDMQTFENVVLALNDQPLEYGLWQRAEPEEIAYAVYVIERLTGKREFSRSIRAYIAAALFHEDLHLAPQSLFLEVGAGFLSDMTKASPEELRRIETHLASMMSGVSADRIISGLDLEKEDESFIGGQVLALYRVLSYLRDRKAL